MVDVVVLQKKAVAAVKEVLGIVGLVVLEFDQAVDSRALAEGQKESDSVGIDLAVELEVADSAAE